MKLCLDDGRGEPEGLVTLARLHVPYGHCVVCGCAQEFTAIPVPTVTKQPVGYCSIINLFRSLMSKMNTTFRSVSYGPCSRTGVGSLYPWVNILYDTGMPRECANHYIIRVLSLLVILKPRVCRYWLRIYLNRRTSQTVKRTSGSTLGEHGH